MKAESDIVSAAGGESERKPRRRKNREAAAKKAEHSIHLPDLKIAEDKDSKKPEKKPKSKPPKAKKPPETVRLNYEPGHFMPLPMENSNVEHEISLHQPAVTPDSAPPKPPVYESPAFSIQNAEPAPEDQTSNASQSEAVTGQPTIEEAQARLREELQAQAQEIVEEPELPEVNEQPATGPVGYEIPPPKQTSEAQPIEEESAPDLPPGHRFVHSAWHSIEVAPDGRPVENPAMTYGQAFAIERHPENQPADEPDDVTLASGQLAVGDTTDIGLSTDGSEPDLGAKKSRDFTNLLNTKQATLRQSVPLSVTNIGDFGLLVILTLVILAIVFALIL